MPEFNELTCPSREKLTVNGEEVPLNGVKLASDDEIVFHMRRLKATLSLQRSKWRNVSARPTWPSGGRKLVLPSGMICFLCTSTSIKQETMWFGCF